MGAEEITSDLKISELKQGVLCKAHEEFHSQASSMLVFSLQWRDLENHFESIRKSLRTQLQGLIEREEHVASRERQLEAREAELSSNLDSKAKELEGIEKLIGEQAKALELSLQHLDSLKSLIQENREELEVKERQYVAIQKLIKEGEEELESLEKRIKQQSKEAESKEKELDSMQRSLRSYKDDIELKDREYNAIRRSVEERKKGFELKGEQLRMCRSSIDECEKEIKLKEENLNSLRNSIAECSNELKLKQKQLHLVEKHLELKERKFVSLKQSVDQCAQQFEMKEMKIEGCLKELELKEKLCESKSRELDLMYKKVEECLKECEVKEKNFSSLQKLVQKRSRELEAKESRFKKTVVEFKMRRKELESSEKSNEVRVKEKTNILPFQVKVEQPEYTHANNAAISQSITKTGKDLQFILNRHLKRHDSVCGELFSVLQASPDPAKLVLDAMEGFYPSQSRGQNSKFDVNIVRRSCILLLEQLIGCSAQIKPQVREEAVKLASDWKAKMKKENYLEAVGFMQFLTSYRLASTFDANELRSLLDIVGQRQGSELRQTLSTADKAPVTIKIEQAENSSAGAVTSSPNLQLSTTQNDIFAQLQTLPDLAKFVLDHIQWCLSQHWKRGDAAFEENSMRYCIFLFEKLWRIFPRIQPSVKEDAMKLAGEWKDKMREKTENHWEALGFLQFLAAYRLVSSFGDDEILKFLETISQHKEALKSCLSLSFASQISEFVRNLIRRKKLTDAVGLICKFNLTHRFSPLPLLTNYMEDLKEYTKVNCKGKKPIEEKDKITDDEIAALSAVIKCIKDYNLDSKNFFIAILNRLRLLEQMKRDRRRSAHLTHSKIEQEHQQQAWKKRKNNTVADHGQPQRGNNKFPRASSSTVGPHGPHIFAPVFPRPPDFPPNPHAFL
ncbi:hypothetical protein L484_010215 [Morus notabilis]|uniref:FRIGIDA-like protein n=1 Tax=Morus notabilis TaxID=981085 RepID=W9RET5_9ROSA|nr:FRIGIDA-like protein 3 [Morus notabilis]EXB67649.1 hypothetical protein L484_010215 [Morus notabilis]